MDNIHLQHIRWTNVNSIFRAIASKPKISRAEIAETTGLSLMTVGKVVDTLIEKNVVSQVKLIKNEVGRRAGIVNLNKAKRLVITSLNFFLYRLLPYYLVVLLYLHLICLFL